MGLYQRGDSPYWWDKYQNPFTKEWHNFSTKQTDEKSARIVAEEQHHRIIKDQVTGKKSDSPTFFPAVKRYLDGMRNQHSIPQKTHYFEFFKDFFGDVPLTKIDRERVREAYRKLEASGLEFSTVNRHFSALRHFFNLIIDDEAEKSNPTILYNPVKAIHFKNESQLAVNRFLEENEKKKLYSKVSPRVRDMIVVAIKSGIRWSEQFDQDGLKWSQLRFDDNDIFLPKTKSGKSRHVPMHPDAKAAFLRQPQYGEYVFSNEDGTPLVKNNRYHLEFTKAVEDLKLTDLTWHCLRHTFGKECAEAGTPQKLIMEWMGHSSMRTSERYTHFAKDYRKEAILNLRSDAGYVSVTQNLSVA